MRVVRRTYRSEARRPHPEVVLAGVPAPRLGADRAAQSGRAAIEFVERIVEVEPLLAAKLGAAVSAFPRGTGWDVALLELVRQLDMGRRVLRG